MILFQRLRCWLRGHDWYAFRLYREDTATYRVVWCDRCGCELLARLYPEV